MIYSRCLILVQFALEVLKKLFGLSRYILRVKSAIEGVKNRLAHASWMANLLGGL